MKDKRLDEFIALCYKISEYIDDCGESDDHFTLDAFGLGYRAASDRIRNGIIAVIELSRECRNERERAKLAKIGENEMRNFMVEIFGDEDFYTVNDEIKDSIKKAARDIEEKWQKEHE